MGRSPEYRIYNVVATASVDSRLDLGKISRHYPNLDYRPEKFPGLPFRLREPKSCTLIFNSGKLVCTGTKSEKEARRAIRKVIKKLGSVYGRKLTIPEISIQNIVASGNFYGNIDLERAVFDLPSIGCGCMYEPEQFPGLIARDKTPYSPNGGGPVEKQGVFLLFATGKFVCTGCKYEESVGLRIENMHQALFDVGCLYPRT